MRLITDVRQGSTILAESFNFNFKLTIGMVCFRSDRFRNLVPSRTNAANRLGDESGTGSKVSSVCSYHSKEPLGANRNKSSCAPAKLDGLELLGMVLYLALLLIYSLVVLSV